MGLLALSREETVYFDRTTDEEGEPLRDACRYRLAGGALPARWWSVTIYGADQMLPRNPDDAASVDATWLATDGAGTWTATVSTARPAAGAWISSRWAGTFSLTLRLYNPPRVDAAVGRTAQRAGEANRLYQAPRPTPANQQVVRTSPDLAYATCALDLATGPVRVTVGGASSYASVAVYDGTTDNVFTLNDRQWPTDGITLVVARTGASVTVAPGERLVRLAGTRGVVLIRRLAPGDSAFARAERERAGDACAPVSGATR